MLSWSPRRCAILATAGAALIVAAACGARTGLPVPTEAAAKPRCTIPSGGSSSSGGATLCNGGTTSISGTVFDPAVRQSLYNVVVYVPSQTPEPFAPGVSCNTCDSLYSGNPVATALTDATGHFTMTGVPAGANVPVVLQVGKWRRQLTIPSVVACQDNPQPDGTLRLPRNRNEGDLPNIAISTGGADTLECIFIRTGIDPSEYVGGAGGAGSIHIFSGSTARPPMGGGPAGVIHPVPNTSPPGPPSYEALWDKGADILPYDMVFLSCEGAETANMNQQVLFDYAAAGGRVFASHFHYAWFDAGPFGQQNLATWTPGSQSIGNVDADIVTTLASGQPFPQGLALQQWLSNNGALDGGELVIEQARHNADVAAANTASQPWIVADSSSRAPGATQYFTFNTPLGTAPASQCGQVVFTDLHVGAASADNPTLPVPAECADVALSPQEMALEFMLFNLSSCVTPPGQTPTAPPPCASD